MTAEFAFLPFCEMMPIGFCSVCAGTSSAHHGALVSVGVPEGWRT